MSIENRNNQEYYKPDLEDIRVGYECRAVNTYFLPSEWGEEKTLGPLKAMSREDIAYSFKSSWNFRTPYLTREQIETEGWTHIGGQLMSSGRQDFTKTHTYYDGVVRNTELKFYSQEHRIEISYDCGEYHNCVIFEGSCPSINEFRYICKLLNFKKDEPTT